MRPPVSSPNLDAIACTSDVIPSCVETSDGLSDKITAHHVQRVMGRRRFMELRMALVDLVDVYGVWAKVICNRAVGDRNIAGFTANERLGCRACSSESNSLPVHRVIRKIEYKDVLVSIVLSP